MGFSRKVFRCMCLYWEEERFYGVIVNFELVWSCGYIFWGRVVGGRIEVGEGSDLRRMDFVLLFWLGSVF